MANTQTNTPIGTVNIAHGAAERIVDAGGNPSQLKQELLAIKADMDQRYFTDIFANSDVAVAGSFSAGSFTYRLKLRNTSTEERVAGSQVGTAIKTTIKEVIAFPNKERNTVPEFWLPEELDMADATAVAAKAIGGQLQSIRNELETNTVQSMVEAAYDEYQNGNTDHFTMNYDFENKTGEEILNDISAKWDILIGGDANNLVKQTYEMSEISTLVNERVFRKLATIFSVMGTGSETQASMLLSNEIPSGIIGGGRIWQAPTSIMGTTTPIIIGTNGQYGSVIKKRRIRIFTDAPARRAGEIETYASYRDMNKVVLPETVFVFSTEGNIPTATITGSTSTTDTIDWTIEVVDADGIGSNYRYEVLKQADGTQADAGSLVVGANNVVSTGLTANTAYEIRVYGTYGGSEHLMTNFYKNTQAAE